MVNTLAIITISFSMLGVIASSSHAGCTERDRQVLRESGWSEYKIATTCGDIDPSKMAPEEDTTRPKAVDFRGKRSGLSNICESPEVICAVKQEAPLGTPCVCDTQYGIFKGVIVSRQ